MLWRLDASYETDAGDCAGVFSTFNHQPELLETNAGALRRRGWDVDVYQEPAQLSAEQRDKLIGRIWPELPIELLLVLGDAPLARAAAELDRIQAARQQAAQHP